MTELNPPPIYSQQDPVDVPLLDAVEEPQIFIIPTVDAVNFQKGFLGADDERATIEGEVLVKGLDLKQWTRATISLRSFEAAYQHETELYSIEIELFSRTLGSTTIPSRFPFAIPLLPDTPQSVQTPISKLSYTLTASFYPSDPLAPCLSREQIVYTKRYSSHINGLAGPPVTHCFTNPTRVEVQIARGVFTAGEVIPIYVTVPPPEREVVVDRGLRLRNVRTELVRVVRVKRSFEDICDPDSDTDMVVEDPLSNDQDELLERSDPRQFHFLSSSSKAPAPSPSSGSSFKTVIARSGASCRFHSSRPIQLRFVINQPLPSTSSFDSQGNVVHDEYDPTDSHADCPSITQQTLLHSITFYIKIYVSFVDMTTRTERISVLSIPIVILGPPARLPEVAPSIDLAYHKKHDRPPAKTTRYEESDYMVPQYPEGEAGPSMRASGAPPPFEERDAPPPFFPSETEASTSARLPTFLESEREIILPESDVDSSAQPAFKTTIPGEGVEFGFLSFQQFDGHSEDMQRSSTPPPTLEMANMDTDLTSLTDINEPIHAIETLSMVLSQRDENTLHAEQPPPPPALDDPSDPPPSIDSDFRTPEVVHSSSSRPPSPHDTPPGLRSCTPLVTPQTQSTQLHAPPPYLVPHNDREHGIVAGPPPYVETA